MLDLKFIRENPELVKKGLKAKGERVDLDALLELDRERRKLIQRAEELKHRRNQLSEEIAARKKSGQDAAELIAETRSISAEIKALDARV
ncbi:MAG: serine--tRNA ligase, partial [Calditrichaeota bacterium]